jgi:hypothetical protein
MAIKLSSVKTVTIKQMVAAVTVQSDTISYVWKDNGTSVTADLNCSNSTISGHPLPGIGSGRITVTLWDGSTTPTYESVGDWTESLAEARVLVVLGLTA